MQVAARIHRAFAASPDATDAPNYPSGPTCQVVLERMRMRFARFVRRPLTAPRLLAGAARTVTPTAASPPQACGQLGQMVAAGSQV